MTMQHKRGIDKGEGFDGAIANITRPTSHMPTVEASLTHSHKIGGWLEVSRVYPECTDCVQCLGPGSPHTPFLG